MLMASGQLAAVARELRLSWTTRGARGLSAAAERNGAVGPSNARYGPLRWTDHAALGQLENPGCLDVCWDHELKVSRGGAEAQRGESILLPLRPCAPAGGISVQGWSAPASIRDAEVLLDHEPIASRQDAEAPREEEIFLAPRPCGRCGLP